MCGRGDIEKPHWGEVQTFVTTVKNFVQCSYLIETCRKAEKRVVMLMLSNYVKIFVFPLLIVFSFAGFLIKEMQKPMS